MKFKYLIILICIPFLMSTECRSNYGFFPDPDDPGLSRFTSRGYNAATAYINDVPFGNNGTYYPLLKKDSTGSVIDTLKFAWPLFPTDFLNRNFVYRDISFLLPVSSSFNKSDLLAFNGKKFSNSISVVIQEIQDTSLKAISGTANLYFVSVIEDPAYAPQKYIRLSGLYDGNIGDSVFITKGRFDFSVDENSLNF